jgi:hypothetical protein
MDFSHAMSELDSGKRIRRKEWEKSVYLQKVDNKIFCSRQEAVPFQYDISIIGSTDWIVVGENGECTFADAVKALALNKKIKLKEWPDDCYLEGVANRKEVFMRRNTVYEFTPTFECFLSTDWEAH